MASPLHAPTPRPRGASPRVVALALVPVLALTVGIPFANRLEPTVLGLPFLLAWIVGWLLLTPVFMTLVYRLDRGRHTRP